MAAIELQVKSIDFLAAQKAVLQGLRLCTAAPIAVGPVQIVIDRISFDNNALRHDQPETFTIFYRQAGQTTDTTPITVPGFQTQLAQTVTVYVAAFDDLLAHPNGTPDVVVPVQFTIVVDVDFFADGQICNLVFNFNSLELGPLPSLPPNFDPKQIPLPITIGDIAAALNTLLGSLIPARLFQIDVFALLRAAQVVLNPAENIINAGISVDSQAQRVALHIDISIGDIGTGEGRKVPWENFFNGVINDRLQGSDWSLFFDGDYLALILQTRVDEAVAGALPDQLNLFVKSTYSNAGGKAVITTDLLGIYHLPDPFGVLEVDPHIPITFSVPAPGFVAVDIGLPDLAQIADALENLVPPFLGPVSDFLQGLFNSAASDLKDPMLPPECKRTSPSNIHCETYVNLPVMPHVVAPAITGLLALDDGFAVTGPLREQPYTLGTLDVTVRRGGFGFVPPGVSCGGTGPEIAQAFGNSPSSFNILLAEVLVSYDGTLPVWLCGVTPLNDPLGVFPASAISWDSAQVPPSPLTIRVRPPIPPANYYTRVGSRGLTLPAYPCDLLVTTTAGSRLVQIPGPPMLTQADTDRLAGEVVVQLARCEQLIDPWFKFHQGYNPQWSVDPLRGETVEHLWQVTVRGLESGETVTLRGIAQQELVTATARAGEALTLSALVAPAGQEELSILHGSPLSAAPAVEPAATHGIEIGQQLMIQLGPIRLWHPCVEVRGMLMMGKPSVLAVTEDGAVAFDMTDPQRPARTGVWRKPGIWGARKWNTGMLLFGEDGLEVIDNAGNRIWTSVKCNCEPQDIIDAAVGSGWIYAASREALRIYTPRLNLVQTMMLDGCHSAILVLGKLVLAGRNGLSIYDLSRLGDPQLAATDDALAIRRLELPLVAEAGTFLATTDDGLTRLLRLDGVGVEAAALFPQKPWFAGALRVGDALIRGAAGGTSLEISRFGSLVVS